MTYSVAAHVPYLIFVRHRIASLYWQLMQKDLEQFLSHQQDGF
jgi:hypothetical protein